MNRKMYIRNNMVHLFSQESNTYFISSHSHFIGLINQQGQLSLYSKLHFKQYCKLRHSSYLYSFSPSDTLLAIANKKLIVIKIGSQKQVYNESINEQEDRIESINFIKENILLAASFISSKIYRIDIANKQTICIIQLTIAISLFNFDSVNEKILIMQKGNDYIQIWNLDGNKLFQSPSLQDIPRELKLLASDNFLVLRFVEYSLIYRIYYEEQKLQFLTLQQSKYIETFSGPQFHYDFIQTLAPKFFANLVMFTFQFKQKENICEISRQLRIPLQQLFIIPSNMSNQKNMIMARNKKKDDYVHYLVSRFREK